MNITPFILFSCSLKQFYIDIMFTLLFGELTIFRFKVQGPPVTAYTTNN